MKHVLVLMCTLLVLSATFSGVQAQSQTETDVPSIDLSRYTWNKTTLHALIITNESQSWWKTSFVNLSQRAIGEWNQAVQFFAANYTQYAYLSRINILSDVSNQTLPGYDMYIYFSQTITLSGSDTGEALGLTTTIPYRNGTIQECWVNLSAKSGIDLTTSNQRDVADHELGHALGLGHSNSSRDLMYPYYDIYSSGNPISTLDLYGLATSFSWITLAENATRNFSVPQFVVLPENISYSYAPVTNPAPKDIGDNPIVRTLLIIFSDPYTTIMAIAFIAFLVVAVLVYFSIGKQRRTERPEK